MSVICSNCDRGPDDCQFCEGLPEDDFEAICDCGLYDFGDHLFDCIERSGKRWVVADGYEAAEEPR